MSCNDTNPCGQPCDPCNETNPCYDDCGCLNPTTFACITKPGTQTNINVTDNMNGLEVLGAINTKIGTIVSDIANIVVPIQNTADTHVKITTDDTTTGFLDDKIIPGNHMARVIINPAGNEKLRLNVTPGTLLSATAGNILTLGSDGLLFVDQIQSDGTETKVAAGAGVTVSGDGSTGSPYVISTNPSIQASRACFDGIWKPINLVASSNANVAIVSGAPQYRIRHDGTIEFKGAMTFTVTFGAYNVGNTSIKQTVTIGSLPTTCVTPAEQAGVVDLKGINYIQTATAGADQMTQLVGYIIRKSAQNIILEFQSSLLTAGAKTIVVNFDGAVSHPNL